MKKLLLIGLLLCWIAPGASAQKNQGAIKVSPSGVNVNSNGATTVFLTFGGLSNQRPAEGAWCGELVPAAPDIGFKCAPETIYGTLPARYDLSTSSGIRGLTDIMSIPASVARRAYQDARDSAKSSFFYVRRFVNTKGGPDENVFVTCRMASGGVSTPFALTDVRLEFDEDQPVVFVKPGEKPPTIKARIVHNGTGWLVGRWEVVMPGEEPPAERDLLTEASLPIEERQQQRRYTEVSRFNVFVPPTGKLVLPGPETARLPTTIEGAYLVLLRIEVSEDKDGGSNLSAVEAGSGFVNSGAVAGFPLPVLRYYVGRGTSGPTAATATGPLALLLPPEQAAVASDQELVFSWEEQPQAAFYRIEIEDAQGLIIAAMLQRGTRLYRAPSWLKDKAGAGQLRWRVLALTQAGATISEPAWRSFQLAPSK